MPSAALLLSMVLAFGYPDDVFFTFTRQEVSPMGCGSDLIWMEPTRPVLILRGVAADDKRVRRAARRAVRSARRELAACRPTSLSSTSNLELALVRADGITRVRAIDPDHVEASAIECVARALASAPWPVRTHAGLRVYLRWSVVQTVLDR